MDKWDRLNPGEEVDVPADMTRLTLDTIALCGFGYRFNSFYRDTPHPFVEAMVRTLAEAQARTRQLPIQTRLKIRAQRQVRGGPGLHERPGRPADRRAPGRRATPRTPRTCSAGCSPASTRQSGERLPDANIRAQCITFLIAGHETTSGLLSFAIYYLLKDPDVLARARAEVDEVLGTTRGADVRAGASAELRPPGARRGAAAVADRAGFNRYPYEDTVIGGRYAIPRAHPDHGAHPRAAPGPGGLGARRGGVQPRPHGPGAAGHAPAERLQAVRHRPAGLHRPAVRPAGGHAGARHAAAALRPHRPPRLPAADEDRRSPSSPTTSTSRCGPVRTCGSSAGAHPRPPPGRATADAPAATATARRPGGPPRHPAAGAVRLQPRHRRVASRPGSPRKARSADST